jgi:hypothetical protein
MSKDSKILEGSMRYRITIDNEDISASWEENNENNFISFLVVQKCYEEIMESQKKPHPPEIDLSKSEMKELQSAMNVVRKHLGSLGPFIHKKYKDAIVETKKPKLDIITDPHQINQINKKARK